MTEIEYPVEIKNPIMTLITKGQMKQLIKGGYNNRTPIVKLFGGPLTWLVTGIEDGVLYGFADWNGYECVRWGSLTTIEELPTMKISVFYLERDKYFVHKDGTDYLNMKSLVGV